jgi:hypothetical protein
MSETNTRRAPGRPRKDAAKPAEKTTPKVQAPAKSKSTVVRRKQEPQMNAEYELISKGGIVTMLPQKGVTTYDPEVDTVREIRYCPNEPSIWSDEQGDKAKKEAVIFREGRLFVPKEKPNMRKFMEVHPGNKANGGNLFKVVDKKAEAEEQLNREFLLNDAISIVREKPIEDLLAVAIYHGININANTSDIRYNLLNVAKKKPQEFIDSFDSPEVTTRSTVQQAKDYQFIKTSPSGVYWFDTNQLIVSVPAGMDPVDVMTRFCLTEKGASVLSNLEEKLSKLA